MKLLSTIVTWPEERPTSIHDGQYGDGQKGDDQDRTRGATQGHDDYTMTGALMEGESTTPRSSTLVQTIMADTDGEYSGSRIAPQQQATQSLRHHVADQQIRSARPEGTPSVLQHVTHHATAERSQ